MNRQIDIVHRKLEERKSILQKAIMSMGEAEITRIDSVVESLSAIKERSSQMFQPIANTTAIGYARSVERVLDFVEDMKDI